MSLNTTVGVGGFTSNAGKTTVMCELLRAFPGWEAIKVSRGHYRSCGKDPQACCISPLLGDEPTVRTGRAETYAAGKDTGRYWDAGAANVHWVVATDRQVERGIKSALARVVATGVFVEGNSFSKYAEVDFMLMVARAGHESEIKPTARRALGKVSAFYLFDAEADADIRAARARFDAWREEAGVGGGAAGRVPLYTREDLPALVARIGAIHRVVAA